MRIGIGPGITIANSPLVHVLNDQPDDDGQVLALIVGRQQNGVLVDHGGMALSCVLSMDGSLGLFLF